MYIVEGGRLSVACGECPRRESVPYEGFLQALALLQERGWKVLPGYRPVCPQHARQGIGSSNR